MSLTSDLQKNVKTCSNFLGVIGGSHLTQSSVSSAIYRVFWKMKCSILEMSGIFFSFSGDGITEKEEELEQVFTL